MSRTGLLNVSLVLAAMLACAVALLVASAKPADAAFPGRNGQIAFHSYRDGATAERIYVMSPNGSGVRPLPQQRFDFSPQWSPSGKKIAFTSTETDYDPVNEVYVMNADGSGAANLTNTPNATEGGVTWYPSGRRIAFCATPLGRNEDSDLVATSDSEVFSLRLGRHKLPIGPPVQLTDNEDSDCPASVSADGKLAFTSDRDGDAEIYVMGANRPESPDNPVVQLTDNDTRDYDADWSPDGSKLAFVRKSPTASSPDVYTMDASGTDVKNLTESDENYDYGPSWSPNGKKVAFTSYGPTEGSGGFEGGIWKMRADGSREIQLTSEYGDGSPDWQPLP